MSAMAGHAVEHLQKGGTMSGLVTAKGLACPEPVILTKKAPGPRGDATAVEDAKRFGAASGRPVESGRGARRGGASGSLRC